LIRIFKTYGFNLWCKKVQLMVCRIQLMVELTSGKAPEKLNDGDRFILPPVESAEPLQWSENENWEAIYTDFEEDES
jgi:hypothetical protein